MILPTKVGVLVEDFIRKVPEVPIAFGEDEVGNLVILLPHDFDTLPGLIRVIAYTELVKLRDDLNAIDCYPKIGINPFQGVITK